MIRRMFLKSLGQLGLGGLFSSLLPNIAVPSVSLHNKFWPQIPDGITPYMKEVGLDDSIFDKIDNIYINKTVARLPVSEKLIVKFESIDDDGGITFDAHIYTKSCDINIDIKSCLAGFINDQDNYEHKTVYCSVVEYIGTNKASVICHFRKIKELIVHWKQEE